jgi:hypothetical protein
MNKYDERDGRKRERDGRKKERKKERKKKKRKEVWLAINEKTKTRIHRDWRGVKE